MLCGTALQICSSDTSLPFCELYLLTSTDSFLYLELKQLNTLKVLNT